MSHLTQKIYRHFVAVTVLFAVSALSTTSACDPASGLQRFVSKSYPQDLVFDVFRNNKLVGEHISRFSLSDNGIVVDSEMTLKVKILFVTVYTFRYTSSSRWCDEQLMELTAETDRNGDVTRVDVVHEADGLKVSNGSAYSLATLNAIPTNHWNPAVLDRSEVINTISGSVNKVFIKQCETGTPRVENAASNSTCYEYSGDLTTRVWYDLDGRWRGLEFSADDGSTINYVCRQCA